MNVFVIIWWELLTTFGRLFIFYDCFSFLITLCPRIRATPDSRTGTYRCTNETFQSSLLRLLISSSPPPVHLLHLVCSSTEAFSIGPHHIFMHSASPFSAVLLVIPPGSPRGPCQFNRVQRKYAQYQFSKQAAYNPEWDNLSRLVSLPLFLLYRNVSTCQTLNT